MNKLVVNIVSLLMMVFFVVAGSGFNHVNYCCDTCEHRGIVAIAKHSCGEVHEHEGCQHHDHTATGEDIACSDLSHKTNDCHLLRLKVETPVLVQLITQTVHVEFIDTVVFVPDFGMILSQIPNPLNNSLSPPPLIVAHNSRHILALKSVLII
jgi:hypothetical protein